MKRKILKLFSLMISALIVLSACFCAGVTVFAETAIYYVSPNGNDNADGLTVNTPKATVNAAITTANSVYKAGDTVNIKLIKDNEKPNIIGVDTNEIVSHEFTVKISSYEVYSGKDVSLLGQNDGLVLGGPTIFQNVRLNIGSSDYPTFATEGHPVTFNKGTDGNGYLYDFVITKGYNKVFDQDINITLNGNIGKKIMFGVWGQPIINGNLNYIINNAGPNRIKLSASYRNDSKVNGNVNINIKSAEDLNLEAGGTTYGNNSAIQIIDSQGIDLEQAKSVIFGIKNVSGNAISHYIIKNKTGKLNGLEFTDTKGKFKVNFDTELYDIFINGNKAKVNNGYITMTSSGEYTVTAIAKSAKEQVFYVKSGVNAGNGTADSPYSTISQAINAANGLGFTKTDTLTVKLLSSFALETLPEYNFNLEIESADEKMTISANNKELANGNTVYKNVKLFGKNLNFAGETVTLEKNVEVLGNSIIDISNAEAVINAELNGTTIITAGNINLVINNKNTVAAVKLKTEAYSDVKINIKAAKSVEFNSNIKVNGDAEFLVNGSAEILGMSYDNIKTSGEKWYIENTTGRSDAIDFTDIPGEYGYKNGWKVELVSGDEIYESDGYTIAAPAGDYIFRTKIRNENVKNINDAQIAEWRKLTDERIENILNTPNMAIPSGAKVYYVSNNGNDSNNGLSPATPIKTLDKVNSLNLPSGSYVCFERGGLWRGQIIAKTGVTYTAYGTGEKPKLYRSPFNGAKASLWTRTENPNVWAVKLDENDVGTLVFNEGEEHAIKIVIRTESDGSTYNNTTGEPFEKGTDLTQDLHFYHDYKGDGTLYLYSEQNPGERFESIEFNSKLNAVHVRCNDVTVDNLCIKYVGSHGVGAGTVRNLTVTNCEFGWIGGSIQGQSEGKKIPTRFGNAVEIYGGCNGFYVYDNYIYQVYDAGITQQVSVGDTTTDIKYQRNIRYARNVIEYSNYSIEYWLSGCPEDNPSRIENFVIEDNYMWYAGLGFPEQRPDGYNGSHINSWYGENHNRAINFVIKDNLMLYSKDILVKIHSSLKNPDGTDGMPKMSGNHYLTELGSTFGLVSSTETILQTYTEEIPYYLDDKSTNDTFWFIDLNHEHWYDNDCDDECNDCYELRSTKHTYDDCTDTECNECGAVDNTRNHTYRFTCSEKCEICGKINTSALEHTWSNACDTICNVCGKTRTAQDHVYDNACDESCNICGDTRNTTGHLYDNNCDTDCNKCGYTRIPTAHQYDNCSDENCNVCGTTRMPENHVYDDEADTDCNLCGEMRSIVNGLVKENGNWYYYVNGIKSLDTTLVKHESKWFYIENGKWNRAFNGLFKYSGKWFYIENGKWNTAITDLIKHQDKWFFIQNGKWDSSINTLFKKNGKWFAVKSGKWYKGEAIITYKDVKFYVNNGFAQLGFSGKVTIGNKTYTVKAGKID